MNSQVKRALAWCAGAKLEIAYCALTIISGLVMIFADKHPARNDDLAHWMRAQQVADGQWMPVRESLTTDLWGSFNANGEFTVFNNTAVNSPVLYYPSVIARLFAPHDYAVASVVTLLCCVATVTAAIRIAGQARALVAAVALLPSFFLSITFPTADAVTNSVALLFAAVVCGMCQREQLSWPVILGVTALAGIVGFTKSTCVTLMLLLFIPGIMIWRASKRIEWRLLLPMACGGATFLFWSSRISDIPPLLGTDFTLQAYEESKSLLVHHPLAFARTLWVTLIQPLDLNASIDPYNAQRNLQLMTGTETVMLPNTVMVPVLLACVLLLVKGNHAMRLFRAPEKLCFAGSALAFYVLTCAAMMLVGNGLLTAARLGAYADGMQSRYFIPVLMPLAMLLPSLGIKVSRRGTLNCWIAGCLFVGYLGLILAHVTEFVIA